MYMSENERLIWAAYVASGSSEGLPLSEVVMGASALITHLREEVSRSKSDRENPNLEVRESYERLFQMSRT